MTTFSYITLIPFELRKELINYCDDFAFVLTKTNKDALIYYALSLLW